MTPGTFLLGLCVALSLLEPRRTAIHAQQAEAVGTSDWVMPPQYKQVQAQALRSARRLLLAMADSMPERLYRDRATPPQRDFAQQIGFAAGEAYRIGSFSTGLSARRPLPDTATAFATRVGLESYINAIYDQLDAWLSSQSDESRNQRINFFGNEIPRWLAWDEITAFTTWTEGQVVANFRKHGMAPPGFSFFDPLPTRR